MGKILFVGVTCVDVVIRVDHLPKTAEDVVVYGQEMALGGCAFNAFWVAHALGEPSVLFSPIGQGAYGDFVRERLAEEGVASPIDNVPGDNGCCYCFVEPSGERTFLAYHGADYVHRTEWFDSIDMDEIDSVYVCGLEVEKPSGEDVVSFLERRAAGKTIFFTPGPRPDKVPWDRVERILDLHPILHLNDAEVQVLAGKIAGSRLAEVHGAASIISERTKNMVLVTMGPDGCYYEAGPAHGSVPGAPATVIDTIGAGDAHIGAVMACLHRGDSLHDALACANRVSASVVSIAGAHPTVGQVLVAARG